MVSSRLANWILACVVAREERQAVLGDLIEEFGIRCGETSNARARLWFWTQLFRSVPWLLFLPVRRSGWVSTAGAACAAAVAQAAIELAIATTFPGIAFAMILILASLVACSCLASLYRPGAGAILAIVTLVSVLAHAVDGDLVHLAIALCAPSAALAGAALATMCRQGMSNAASRTPA